MSLNCSNVPIIAITADDDPLVESNDLDIENIATDTEELCINTERKKKKQKKHLPKKDISGTDIEDLEVSDNEISTAFIKHEIPIDIEEFSKTSYPIHDETCNADIQIDEGKRKLKTQSSVISCEHLLKLNIVEENLNATDLEDFEKSDEDCDTSQDVRETNILNQIMQDSETITISDSIKISFMGTPSRAITPGNDLSKNERKKSKNLTSINKVQCQNMSALIRPSPENNKTDAEIKLYGSGGQMPGKEQEYIFISNENYVTGQNSGPTLTDSDALEISDDENSKVINENAVSDVLKFYCNSNTGRVSKVPKSFYRPSTPKDSFSSFTTMGYESENEDETILTKDSKRKQRSTHYLEVQDKINDALTDTEEIDFHYKAAEDSHVYNENSYFTEELDSWNGIIEEKAASKENSNLYNIRSSVTKRIKNYDPLQNSTDEEECETDVTVDENSFQHTKGVNINLTFTSKNNSRKHVKTPIIKTRKSYFACDNTEEYALTETEDLYSSDEDPGEYEIPVTIINKNTFEIHTDTESIDEQNEDRVIEDMPEFYVVESAQKIIHEKENINNTCEIFVTAVGGEKENADTFSLTPIYNYDLTDMEEFSADEEILQDTLTEPDKDFDIQDLYQSVIEQADTLKSPDLEKMYDDEIDAEEITTNTAKKSHFCDARKDDTSKYTDVEDFELSDVENLNDSIITLRLNRAERDINTNKTDTEDFEASDNEYNNKVSLIEQSATPGLLKEMNEETICTKKGTGKYSKETNNLNKKNISHTCCTLVSPTHTDTDECVASGDDESYSRAETATPLQMTEELDEASSLLMHSQNIKKIDFEAEDEVMYLKGGGFVLDSFTDVEDLRISEEEYFSVNDKNNDARNNNGWSPSEHGLTAENQLGSKQITTQGAAPHDMKGLLQLDTGAVHMDCCIRNHRNFGNGCNESSSAYPFCSPIPPTQNLSTYNQLDEILDHMLAEVDEQERLAKMDSDEKSLKPICVNSLNLFPATDALIEIPIVSPKLYQTKHEIIINETKCDNLSKHLSLESLTDTYFLESSTFAKHRASVESLNDFSYDHINKYNTEIRNDENIYEVIEQKADDIILNDENLFSDKNIWWEGVYRDLSIVPEEDEDDVSVNIETSKQFKYINDCTLPNSRNSDLPKNLISDDNCDNISHHSSSDISQTTGDDCDTSDIEHNIISSMPVKAEIKLLVKTLGNNKQVEVKSVQEFKNQSKNDEVYGNNSNQKFSFSRFSNFPVKSDKYIQKATQIFNVSESQTEKPCFTLQRLFIRCPKSENSLSTTLNISNEVSKNYPELVASSNVQYPLDYISDNTNKVSLAHSNVEKNVDLYANTPFYPCYNKYNELHPSDSAKLVGQHNIQPLSSCLTSFPSAYCDWLVQPGDPNGGIPTTPRKELVSNEDSVNLRSSTSNVITGESIIHDIMSKDLRPTLEKTSEFIEMESQPEISNECMHLSSIDPNQVSETSVSLNVTDKSSKEIDNKKEKSKGKGFFSSLKSFVGKSHETFDPEFKEDKYLKKKKKGTETPQKQKKAEKDEGTDKNVISKTIAKPKYPSPKEDRKPIALGDRKDIDSIPCIDETDINGLESINLDSTLDTSHDLKTRATAIVDNVLIDGQNTSSIFLEDKPQEINIESTVTPEEIRRSTEPIIINEDEFLVVIEENVQNVTNDINKEKFDRQKSTSPPNVKREIEQKDALPQLLRKQKHEEKEYESEHEDKVEQQKSKKSIGFLKLFGKKESRESDEETGVEQPKHYVTKSEIEKTDHKQDEQRKSSGFFGMFAKKSKREYGDAENEKIDGIKATDIEKLEVAEEKVNGISEEVQQQMVDTAHFLLKEVELFEDVKLKYENVSEEPVTNMDIRVSETTNIKDDNGVEYKPPQHIAIKNDEEKEEQRRSTGFFGIFSKKPKRDSEDLQTEKKEQFKSSEVGKTKIIIKESEKIKPKELFEDVQQEMDDSAHFLRKEEELFQDVQVRYQENIEQAITEADVKIHEASTTNDKAEIADKSQKQAIVKCEDEKSEHKQDEPRKSIGFFAMFNKKPKRDSNDIENQKNYEMKKLDPFTREDEIVKPVEFSQQVQQEMVDTARFLLTEVEYFEDVKEKYCAKDFEQPAAKKDTEIDEIPHVKGVEISKEQNIVDEKKVGNIPEFSRELQQQIVDTTHFLLTEIEFFEDVMPKQESPVTKDIQKIAYVISPTEHVMDDLVLEKQKENQKRVSIMPLEIPEKLSKDDIDETDEMNKAKLTVTKLIRGPDECMTTDEESQSTEEIKKDLSSGTTKSDSETSESKHAGFFSKLGEKFTGRSPERKAYKVHKEAKQKRKHKPQKVDKSKSFFSKLGEKLSGSSQDAEDNIEISDENINPDLAAKQILNVKDTTKEKENVLVENVNVIKGKISDDITKMETLTQFAGDVSDETRVLLTAENKLENIETTIQDKTAAVEKILHAPKESKDFFDEIDTDIKRNLEKMKKDVNLASKPVTEKPQENISNLTEVTGNLLENSAGIHDNVETVEKTTIDTDSETKTLLTDLSKKDTDNNTYILQQTGNTSSNSVKDITQTTKDFDAVIFKNGSEEGQKAKDVLKKAKNKSSVIVDTSIQTIKEKISGTSDYATDSAEKAPDYVKDVTLKATDSGVEMSGKTLKKAIDRRCAAFESTVDTVSNSTSSTDDYTTSSGMKILHCGEDFIQKEKDSGAEILRAASEKGKFVENARDSTCSALETSIDTVKKTVSSTRDYVADFTEKSTEYAKGITQTKPVGTEILKTTSEEGTSAKHLLEKAKDSTSVPLVSSRDIVEDPVSRTCDYAADSIKKSAEYAKYIAHKTEAVGSEMLKRTAEEGKIAKDKGTESSCASLESSADTLKESISSTVDHAIDSAKKSAKYAEVIAPKTKTVGPEMLKATSEGGRTAKELLEKAKHSTSAALESSRDTIKELVSSPRDRVTDPAKIAEYDKDITRRMKRDDAEMLRPTSEEEKCAKHLLEKVKDSSSTALMSGTDTLKGTLSCTYDDAAKKSSEYVEDITEIAKSVGSEMLKRTSEEGKTAKALLGKAKDSGSIALESSIHTITESLASAQDCVTDSATKSTEYVKDVTEISKTVAAEKIKRTSEEAKSAKQFLEKAKDSGSSALDASIDSVKEITSRMGDLADDSVKKSFEYAKDMTKTAKAAGAEALMRKLEEGKTAEDLIEKAKDNTSTALESHIDTAGESVCCIRDHAADYTTKSTEYATDITQKAKTIGAEMLKRTSQEAKYAKHLLEKPKDSTPSALESSTDTAKETISSIGDLVGHSAKTSIIYARDITEKPTVVGAEMLKRTSEEEKTKKALLEKAKDSSIALKSSIDTINESVSNTRDYDTHSAKKPTEYIKDITQKSNTFAAEMLKTTSEDTTSAKDVLENAKNCSSSALQSSVDTIKETSFEYAEDITQKGKTTKHLLEKAKESSAVGIDIIEESIACTRDHATDPSKKSAKHAKDTIQKANAFGSEMLKGTPEEKKDTETLLEKALGSSTDTVKETMSGTRDCTSFFAVETADFVKDVTRKGKDYGVDILEKTVEEGDVKEDILYRLKSAADKTKFIIEEGKLPANCKDDSYIDVNQKKLDTCKISENITDDNKLRQSVSYTKADIQNLNKNSKEFIESSLPQVAKESFEDTAMSSKNIENKIERNVLDTTLNASKQTTDSKLHVTKAEELSKSNLENKSKQTKKDDKYIKDVFKELDKQTNNKNKTGAASDKEKSEYVCYVTTPTMQRRGVGGSQRLSRDERPALLDVSNMPTDISSDEDEYIVTEPVDKEECKCKVFTDESPILLEDSKTEDYNKELLDSVSESPGSESKRRPLFHIGSKDEELVDLGDKCDKKSEEILSMHPEDTNISTNSTSLVDTKTFTDNSNVQADIESIETKLSELGKALDDLEKANLEIESQERLINDPNERKLRRVERRFERMASETMEVDSKEAKEKQIPSPEVEVKREEEYRKMVAQLSQDEVSEYQKLYSTLWDEAAFTPSEEFDSKTPDSQPDDIQELPQGEVVYMGPVTLNKDVLVNKAGIEIDIIPIKRSPCSSPLSKKKLKNKGRAKSAMGFCNDKMLEERGSLPDLQTTGKSSNKSEIRKGDIVSAIMKLEPSVLKDDSASSSTRSLYFNTSSNERYCRRKSTESLTRGTVLNAVKEWMAKCTPFGSTDNVRSIDGNSFADTTVSLFDDDDIDSIDMYSDICERQIESDGSRSENPLPEILIQYDVNHPAVTLYESLHYCDANASTKTVKKDDLPCYNTRRISHIVDQFSLGETSSGLLTSLATEVSTHQMTNINKTDEFTSTFPKPKPRTDKTPDIQYKVDSTEFISTPNRLDTETTDTTAEEHITETYLAKKKFWENVTSAKKDVDRPEHSVKKRLSLYEEHIYKQPAQENIISKKRQSVHELSTVPPIPKPRSAVLPHAAEDTQGQICDSARDVGKLEEIMELKEFFIEKSQDVVSEYKAAFQDPSTICESHDGAQLTHDITSVTSDYIDSELKQRSESLDSETEYLKYEAHQIYDNSTFVPDEEDSKIKTVIKKQTLPQVKRRQMSISQPPVAATRKTIFERSVSLPTDDLEDVCDNNVRARKQFFEQQIKNEMVIDQLKTQLEEEELQEYKTLTEPKDYKPDQIAIIKGKPEDIAVGSDIEKDSEFYEKELGKDIDKKLSPISSSSSQDTKTEDDITQYTPTSVKDLTKYFQTPFSTEPVQVIKQKDVKADFASSPDQTTEEDLSRTSVRELEKFSEHVITQDIDQEATTVVLDYDAKDVEDTELFSVDIKGALTAKTGEIEKENALKEKQPSTESDHTISSERSIELGSGDEIPSHITEVFQYKSDSTSKPSDSLEVHVDKSEIEDSEKVTDLDQDATDEVKTIGMEGILSDVLDSETGGMKSNKEDINLTVLSPVKQPKQIIPDVVWEVQSQRLSEIEETVTEIPIERQIIIEKDEELSGSVRDESDLGSEIHQDHSDSCDSENVKSGSHSEVEQLILESLYYQKIRPEEARKIASELIDDIEAEIQRTNYVKKSDFAESEPPAPDPDIAKNQISDYLRQLAESKGLDAKEVQLVESVLARKQNELFKLSRRDTQTSSMEITDEDLKYSGAECSITPSESHENILEEQIEQLESEYKTSDFTDKISLDREIYSQKSSDTSSKNIYFEKDQELYENDQVVATKLESTAKTETAARDEQEIIKEMKKITDDAKITTIEYEKEKDLKAEHEKIEVETDIKTKSDICTHTQKTSAVTLDDERKEYVASSESKKISAEGIEIEEIVNEEKEKVNVMLDGTLESLETTQEQIDGGILDKISHGKSAATSSLDEQSDVKREHSLKTIISDDGKEFHSSDLVQKTNLKTVRTIQMIDETREEIKSVISTVEEKDNKDMLTKESEYLKQIFSDESKTSPSDSAKSPVDQTSASSSIKKDDSDISRPFENQEVILRKSKLLKDGDSSSSSGNLKSERKSGTDFEAYSSSGESHYHSFEQDSAKSRPCSSDVEGLIAAGSSEYESALTSQEISSRSHLTSTEYHTAVSSLSSRESMKSLDSESSGHMASVEISEASETLVPSTFELEGDILDGAMGQLLEDEIVEGSQNGIIEPYDREIPEYVIRGEFQIREQKSSFDTISDSEVQGESVDISEEDSAHEKSVAGETTSKMKRSQEMTFQPEPKVLIADSPQSETALEMDERFGSSLEDGSVLSISLSSTSDATALRTVIEQSRRDSDRLDGSLIISETLEQLSIDESVPHFFSQQEDTSEPLVASTVDSSTSTLSRVPDSLNSVTITTSTIQENGIQSVSTQVISQTDTLHSEVYNGPTQVDYVPEYDDIVENRKIKGHRRQESTSKFVPTKIQVFSSRTDSSKSSEASVVESDKFVSSELTLKEVHSDELKDVDETEEQSEDEGEFGFYEKQKKQELSKSETVHKDKTLSTDREIPSSETHSQEPGSIPAEQNKTYDVKQEIASDTLDEYSEIPDKLLEKQRKSMSLSEKSSVEEAEAEAAFSMVAHISPAHKVKGDICPIMEDEDAEKHELETRERAQKELEKRISQIYKEKSPSSIPDIMVTEHMTPLVDRAFHYPDLELEEKEALAQKSIPETPASISSNGSEETDQGGEYILDNSSSAIITKPKAEYQKEIVRETESVVSQSTIEKKTSHDEESNEPPSTADSPNSDSFEMLEKPDIIDDFVVIEEVAKEAAEHDSEGKSVQIKQMKYIRKHDEEVEEYLVKSAPTPLTRMTDLKYYPDGSSTDELGPFDFEESPPQALKKTTESKDTTDVSSARTYGYEYDRELEASKKWIEMQFQGDQAALISAGYGYEMEFERGPLEDIKEEEATDFESSRIGSLDSQKQSIGSLGSVKDSFSSTPEYDVLAGRKFFTRSGEHDDVSMSSLQEFEHLERVISLENRRHHQGSQDSSSNGSFSRRYHAGRSGQGDDVSLSSLKEFEGLESACIEAHKIEIKAKEEEALLTQIDEAQENLISESESCKSVSSADKKGASEAEDDDYDKRMFEIEEIIRQAQTNVEKFIDIVDKTESIGRGDSLEEVAKVPDLELDEPFVKSSVHTVKWSTDDVMQTSTDSLDMKPSHHASTDSLDMKATAADLMTASTDSIEYQIQSRPDKDNLLTDSIDLQDQDKSCMITSDSLELTPGMSTHVACLSDSIDEDGSRVVETNACDQSSSSGRLDDYSFGKEETDEQVEIQDQRAEFLLGSTDSLDPSSSTATHATYQYETDSVMSGSFTSGGSNTMVSSTDTIDPSANTHSADLAAAVRKVWFDDDAFSGGSHFTTELLDDGSKPFVTEVIEPCEDDPDFSHTVHRKIELPAEIKKITFKGPDADLKLRQYIDNFGEGEDMQEMQETDNDGNVHIKRVVQKRFIVKTDESGQEKRISGPELESFLQNISHTKTDSGVSYKDPSQSRLTKQTHMTADGTKTIYAQKFTTKSSRGEEFAVKQLLSSIASDVSDSVIHHVDIQQETSRISQPMSTTDSTEAHVPVQGSRRKPLRYDISIDDQTEVDPREHDWRFNLTHYGDTADENVDSGSSTQDRSVTDQHQLSAEMKDLLAEMEKHSKQ